MSILFRYIRLLQCKNVFIRNIEISDWRMEISIVWWKRGDADVNIDKVNKDLDFAKVVAYMDIEYNHPLYAEAW